MRIGLNTLYLIPGKVGGTETYARRLIDALQRESRGHEFIVYTNRENAGTFELTAPNFREHALPVRAESRVQRLALEQTLLPRAAKADGIDVLHSLGYTAPLRAPCPTVVTLHDLNYHFHPEDWSRAGLYVHRFLIPRVARSQTRVLTISQSSRSAIVRVLGLDPSKVDVVYHGVDGNVLSADAQMRQQVRTRYGLDSAPFLLTVTASHPHKNLDGLVRAYRQFTERVEETPTLVVVGVRGRAQEQLEADARAITRGRVVVTGWIDADVLAALYAEARLFVFPSKYEGFGFPILEAMQVGTPVASSRATSLEELAGDAALLFDPNRDDQMASAMASLWTDSELRKRLIARGREQAAKFTWQRCARETIAVYDTVHRR